MPDRHRSHTALLRVARCSDPRSVAGSIAHALRAQERVRLRAIGADAVNTAVKAVAIARRYLCEDGYDLYMEPAMVTLTIQGRERTAVEIEVVRGVRNGN